MVWHGGCEWVERRRGGSLHSVHMVCLGEEREWKREREREKERERERERERQRGVMALLLQVLL